MRPSLSWNWITIVFLAELLLGLTLLVARIQVFALPCGGWLGCTSLLHNSPKVAGLHLTEYAVIYPLGGLALLFWEARVKAQGSGRILLPAYLIVGLIVAFVSNAYAFIFREQLCLYCSVYALLTLAGVVVSFCSEAQRLSDIWKSLPTILSCWGICATLVFGWVFVEVRLGHRTGLISGVIGQQLLDSEALVIGDSTAPRQVICFFSPVCQSCKDEVRRFQQVVWNDPGIAVRLYAYPPKELDQGISLCAAVFAEGRLFSSQRAIELLCASSEAQEYFVRERGFDSRDVKAVMANIALGNALDVRKVPSCILIESGSARFVPCWSIGSEVAVGAGNSAVHEH